MKTLDRAEVSKIVRGFLEQIRPPERLREKLDYQFRYYDHTVELIEVRPRFNGPGKTGHAFAKATFIKSRGRWKVYWVRGNGRWYPYDPPTTDSLKSFLRAVKEDALHCFFG